VGDVSVGVPHPLATLAFGDLRDRAAADHRARLFLKNIGIARAAGGLVLGLDQQPRPLLCAGPAAHTHEMPSPVQLLALSFTVQMAFLEGPARVAVRMPAAAVPDQHRAAAVLALRNGALERVVLDRMILHLNRQTLLARDEARTAGNRPALHHAVELE